MLRVLGVLKVATVEQIQQIAAPHLSYPHTDKTTPSKRKQARTASHLGALCDLRKHGLQRTAGRPPLGAGESGPSRTKSWRLRVLARALPS
ncbi:hypothetical protein [Streptomyces hawaiiensis]|uniref:hypothetical protein n=1 Tax=Streptomyces hawaiiensis TaxID=67305 RepID=UPI0036575FD2